jgi:peptidoglycan/LPS O-acetylase OafA/YrhL
MNNRYLVNTGALAAGAFLVVASRVFTDRPLEWITFGVSAGVTAAAVAALALFSRQRRHLAGFGALAVVAAWSAVAALIFTGTTLAWLAFADSIAIAVVALVALMVHEVTTERVVHTLEVRQPATAL